MHFTNATVLIIVVALASLYLLFNNSERMFPTIAVIASGIELLLAFGLMSLSVAKFRIDVILPALLLICGVFCWSKSQEKSSITAASVVTLIAIIQLLNALKLF